MLCNVDGVNECGFATNKLIPHVLRNLVSGKSSKSNSLRRGKKKTGGMDPGLLWRCRGENKPRRHPRRGSHALRAERGVRSDSVRTDPAIARLSRSYADAMNSLAFLAKPPTLTGDDT